MADRDIGGIVSADGGVAPPDAGEVSRASLRRDRLLAALALIMGTGLALALPFALKAGAEFFLPVTAAIVVAIALVPILEWLERRRLPSGLAALVCVLLFLSVANLALVAIVVPASEFLQRLPDRINRIQSNIAPVLDLYQNLESFVNRTVRHLASTGPIHAPQSAATAAPSSILELAATSAPAVLIQLFFGLLLVFFFLAGWTRIRRSMITNRASFGGAMATARVIQDVVDDTSAYLGTITVINVFLGSAVGVAMYAIGMPYPLMWGGIVALFNYIPYIGPISAAVLLALGGLMTFQDIWWALAPAAIMIGCHLLEANAITPLIVGHRLTINPMLILLSISYWGWVWGWLGALLAVPLLIILQTIIRASGKPDIAGFLFERGTLTNDPAGAPPRG